MNKIAVFALVIIITGSFLTIAYGNIEETLFDSMSYNYTSHILIPANNPDNGSIGGYYRIHGQGRDFDFSIVLPGAENAESPLDYTNEGLNGTGKIDNIDITYDTVIFLFSGEFKKAMFETRFNGTFNMNCAAWTGSGTFSSESGSVQGTFKIDGPCTDWEGTFNVKNEDNRIVLLMNYMYYPNGNTKKAKKLNDTVYM